ncbi:histidinol-phosphate transaminase [Legionella israelensis]|uniref:Histidinol-phosphate aminotransferase n=1 Tax=Legionella israelensis TaxID=454 RepID=A0AAX1EEI2_9GAMM|nr:histidinol-phosphate transaminase [Legionella israelensis]QBR83474.1 histidinol-phosphate transaminase [Legionella israelensis]
MSIIDLIRSDLKAIKPYVPEEVENCRLHANELPWTPVPFNQIGLNRYPETGEQKGLQANLADMFQVNPEQMLLTRGSDDAIDLIFRLFLQAGVDSLMQCPPTFSMYAFYARLQRVKLINCPLYEKEDFRLSIDRLLSAWEPDCKLIMLCRPNNPTGSMVELTSIVALCKQMSGQAIVVVDEAYIDFAEAPSASGLLSSCENLIVLRTLSKAYGLAGLRLGAIIAQAEVIEVLKSIMPPYTLSTVVVDLAKRALADKSWFQKKIRLILEERARLMRQFAQCIWISKVYSSHANFILVASEHAASLKEWFAKQGIAVRHFSEDALHNMLRITVGDERENQHLLSCLRSFRG